MVFTSSQRDQLRTYFGFPLIWANANATFEGIMNAIDGLQDGGATEAAVIAVLNQLVALDAQIAANAQLMLATEVTNEVKIDAARNDAYLRTVVGPGLIHQLSIRFSMNPAEDYYAAAPVGGGGYTVMHKVPSL
jgi:hypothetical protein